MVAGTIAKETETGQQVVVYAHWGEEYSQSILGVEHIAQLFVNSGAVAIFGSHPHVVIPKQSIDGSPVYYSLGNFLFDQYWNEDVTSGLAVMATIGKGGIETHEYPVTLLPDGRTCRAE